MASFRTASEIYTNTIILYKATKKLFSLRFFINIIIFCKIVRLCYNAFEGTETMKKYNISNKELDILAILWESDSGLTAKEIHEKNPELIVSTIQVSLNKLIKKNLIEVKDIIYSGKVLTRKFAPTITKENFVVNQYEGLNLSLLLNEFLGNKSPEKLNSELDELEEAIRKKKRDLK